MERLDRFPNSQKHIFLRRFTLVFQNLLYGSHFSSSAAKHPCRVWRCGFQTNFAELDLISARLRGELAGEVCMLYVWVCRFYSWTFFFRNGVFFVPFSTARVSSLTLPSTYIIIQYLIWQLYLLSDNGQQVLLSFCQVGLVWESRVYTVLSVRCTLPSIIYRLYTIPFGTRPIHPCEQWPSATSRFWMNSRGVDVPRVCIDSYLSRFKSPMIPTMPTMPKIQSCHTIVPVLFLPRLHSRHFFHRFHHRFH